MMDRIRSTALEGAPYRIHLIEHALPDWRETLQWVAEDPGFKRHQSDFFDQCELGAMSSATERTLPWTQDRTLLKKYVSIMNELYEEEFLSVVRVVFHRLGDGQGIGVHTDETRPGFETHRLVVTLNEHWDDSWGGHFFVLRSDSADDVHAILRPTPNLGIAFEMTPLSFHAVGEVSQAVRYSVVLSFWAARALHGQLAAATFQELTRDALFLD